MTNIKPTDEELLAENTRLKLLISDNRELEKEFNKFFELLPVMIVIASRNGNFKRVNKIWGEVLGYDPEELIGKSYIEFVHPEDIESTKKLIETQINKQYTSNFVNRYRCKNGDYKILSWVALPSSDGENLYGVAYDITELKHTEYELISAKEKAEESEARLVQAQRTTKVGSWETDLSSLKVIWSAETYNIFELDKDTFRASHQAFIDFVHPEDKEAVNSAFFNSFKTKDFNSIEHRIITAKGTTKFVEERWWVEYDENDNPIRAIGTCQDITERKNTEFLIKQNSDRLRILLSLSQMKEVENDKLYNYALEKAIEICNSKIGFLGFLNDQETFVRIHEWSESTMQSCKIKDKYIDFEVAQTGIWGEVIRQRKPYIINDYNAENPLIKGIPKGHVAISNYLSVPLFEKGKIVLIVAVGNKEGDYTETDIHELTLLMDGVWNIIKQKNYEKEIIKAKEKAEESEYQLRAMINAVPDLIFRINSEGEFLSYKADIKDLYYKSDSIIGKNYQDLMPENFVAFLREKIDLAIHTNDIQTFEYILEIPELGVKTYEARMSKSGENEVTAVVRDITEQKKIGLEIIKAKEKAEESDRLKTAFLQNMSHEIRTPLNAISGFVGLLSKPNLSQEKRNSFIQIIQNSSNQLVSIVSDILTISSLETKQEIPNISVVCINSIIVELLAMFKQQAINQNVALYAKRQLSDKQSEILTDKTKVTQVLSNLLSNALKFTHEGFVEFGYILKDNFLEFYVKDSGIGIKPEFHESIFERFRQVNNSTTKLYGGTGLGLAISKAFVELLGGKIWVQSEFEKGSIFYFTTPYNPVNEINKTKTPGIQNESLKTILVAEDEEYNFLFIEELFIEFDVVIIHTKDGKETVEKYKSNPNIDLVLMDIKMPVMNGHEAAKIIKSVNPDLPIVAQSAYALEQERAVYEGIFDDYITKPINGDVLTEIILKYIEIRKK